MRPKQRNQIQQKVDVGHRREVVDRIVSARPVEAWIENKRRRWARMNTDRNRNLRESDASCMRSFDSASCVGLPPGGTQMRKTLIAVAAAASVAGAAITGASPAKAWCFWGCDAGAGAAAGPPGGPLLAGQAQPYGAYYGYGPSYLLCAGTGLLRAEPGVLLAQSAILGRQYLARPKGAGLLLSADLLSDSRPAFARAGRVLFTTPAGCRGAGMSPCFTRSPRSIHPERLLIR